MMFLVLFHPVESHAAKAKLPPSFFSKPLAAEYNWHNSPYTGWTREHFIEVTGRIAAGMVQYMDPESGMPTKLGEAITSLPHIGNNGYSEHQMREAYERSMMAAAAYAAASGKTTIDGYDRDLVQPYLTGLIRGTDPDDKFYWGVEEGRGIFGNCIIISILAAPGYFWEPLTARQKQNVANWLKLLEQKLAWDNNHYLFHMSTVSIMNWQGVEANRVEFDRRLDRIMGFARGDGWFIDGDNQGFDKYNYWGFHLFLPLLYRYDQHTRDMAGGMIESQMRAFLQTMPWLQGADGAPVPWGRSLSYRFGVLAPLGWAQAAGISSLDPGLARRIAAGTIKFFFENGMISEKGLLEPGYLGPNAAVPEVYVAQGAPYMATSGLYFLSLPEDDPFWTSQEKPLPVECESGVKVIRGAKMVAKVDAQTGEARLYKIGESFWHPQGWQYGIKYYQHAYSSNLGFPVVGQGGPQLVMGRSGASADGIHWSLRQQTVDLKISDFENVSVYDLSESATGESGAKLYTHTYIGEHGEVHVIYHNCSKPLYLAFGGWGIQVPHGESVKSDNAGQSLKISSSTQESILRVLGSSGVDGKLRVVELEPRTKDGFTETHLYGGRGAFPLWESSEKVVAGQPVIFYVNAARGTLPFEVAEARFPNIGPVSPELPAEDQAVIRIGERKAYFTANGNYQTQGSPKNDSVTPFPAR